MENILNKLESSSDIKSIPGLADEIKAAKDVIANKDKTPIHEIRQKLFDIFAKTFAAKKSKSSLSALDGLQTIIRDSSFHTDLNECRMAESLATQLLACLEPMISWSPQIQPQIFTTIVQLISRNELQISLAHVFTAMELCFKVYLLSDDPGVKLAIRAALTQLLNSYCLNRQLRATEINLQEEVATLMEITTLLNKILPRLDCSVGRNNACELQLALDALYSILSAQPPFFYRHAPLLSLFRSEIIPALICLLQVYDNGSSSATSTASKPKLAITKRLSSLRGHPASAAAGAATGRPNIFATPEIARSFYQVVEQILLFFGRQEDAKLMLELYRNALLAIPTVRRLEALKLIKRMVLTPQRLFVFLTNLRDEPLYWLIPMECLEECSQCTNIEISVEALQCMNALLTSLAGFIANINVSSFSSDFMQKIDEECIEIKGSVQKIQVQRKSNSSSFSQASTQFFNGLNAQIATWSELDDWRMIDHRLQQFAIDTSTEFSTKYKSIDFSATVIYLTAYAAIDLLVRCTQNEELEDFESWLVKITTAGTSPISVAVDKKWLSEVYELIVFAENNDNKNGFILQLVNDYSGSGGYVFTVKDEKDINSSNTASKQKIERWLKNVVASCWGSIMVVLSRFSLRDHKKGQLIANASISLSHIGEAIEAITFSKKVLVDGAKATLECMHSLLTLLIRFGLYKEMTWVYERLGEEVCQLEELRQLTSSSTATAIRRPWILLNRNDAFAVSMMLENAIRHSNLPDSVLKYVIRAVEYISELERYLFQTRNQQVYYPNGCASGNESSEAVLDLSANELMPSEVSKVLDELLLKIDKFFENSPKNLSLSSTCTLITTLININENNLKCSGEASSTNFSRITCCVLLQRISQLVCGVHGRGFIHLLKAWHCAKNHFIEVGRLAAFSKFPDEVTKISICCIYDCMKAILVDENADNRHHFNFNNTLFSAFQTILCDDVAKPETQEHIVSILGTFIEEKNEKIGSGWKPLFTIIKSMQVRESGSIAVIRRTVSQSADGTSDGEDQMKLSPVNVAMLDLFKKFLEIQNRAIVYAVLPDYIHCLISSLHALSSMPNRGEDSAETIFAEQNIATATLVYINDAVTILLESYDDPRITHFNKILHNNQEAREKFAFFTKLEDCMNRLKLGPDLADQLPMNSNFLGMSLAACLESTKLKWSIDFPWAKHTPIQKNIEELLCELIESLCGILPNASQNMHSQIASAISELILRINTSPLGAEFGAFLLGQQIFTALQSWAIESPRNFILTSSLTTKLRNLKQSTGMFTHLVVEFVDEFSNDAWCENLLRSALLIFLYFISHSSQFISGIGCSCLKHLLISASHSFTPKMWQLVARTIWDACNVTLFPLRVLIDQFFPNSNELCGDMGEMAITIDESRRVSEHATRREFIAMAKQVFLIDLDGNDAKNSESKQCPDDENEPNRQFCYNFTFGKPSADEKFSITLEEVICGLFNHKTLIQIISEFTNGNSVSILAASRLSSDLLTNAKSLRQEQRQCELYNKKTFETDPKSGSLTLANFLFCLEASAQVAKQFNDRPALKFLMQKLSTLDEICGEISVNLYKTYVACESILLWTLFEVASMQISPNGADSNQCFTLIQRFLDECLDDLQITEDAATKHKLALFAREKYYEPIDFLLNEHNVTINGSIVKSLRVVKIKEYNAKKGVEAPMPSGARNFDASAFSLPVNKGGAIINPFTQTRKLSSPTTDAINKDKTDEDAQGNDISSNFKNLDLCVLFHSEIVALFLANVCMWADLETLKALQPWLSKRVYRYLLLTGNGRARSAVALFLERLIETTSTTTHA